MPSIAAFDKKSQTTMLDGVAALARLFWGPDIEISRDLLLGSFLRPFEALESRVKYEPASIIDDLRGIISGFGDENAIFQYLEEAYVRLFINSRQGTTAPLYASCYVDDRSSGENAPLMGPPAVLMKQKLESRGLTLSETMHEPPDHLSIELEYLYFLLQTGWADNDPARLSESVTFAGEVMLPWTTILRKRIADEKVCRFYPLITSVAVSILAYLGRHTLSI
jgi:TorA-specific chaperone